MKTKFKPTVAELALAERMTALQTKIASLTLESQMISRQLDGVATELKSVFNELCKPVA